MPSRVSARKSRGVALPESNRGAKTPLYADIASVLADRINAGQYPVGEALPGEMDLCVMFGASRHTIREAIRVLSSQGIVSKKQGIGTIVRSPETQASYVATLTSLSDLMQHLDATELHIKSNEEVVADEQLAELLECPVGQRWVRIKAFRVLKRTQEVVSITDVYVQLRFSGIRELLGRKQTSVYELIEDHYGTQVFECLQVFYPFTVSRKDALILNVSAGTPGLLVTRQYFDKDMELLTVSVNKYPKNRFRFELRWRRSN